jgi:hypothetical protein
MKLGTVYSFAARRMKLGTVYSFAARRVRTGAGLALKTIYCPQFRASEGGS